MLENEQSGSQRDSLCGGAYMCIICVGRTMCWLEPPLSLCFQWQQREPPRNHIKGHLSHAAACLTGGIFSPLNWSPQCGHFYPFSSANFFTTMFPSTFSMFCLRHSSFSSPNSHKIITKRARTIFFVLM